MNTHRNLFKKKKKRKGKPLLLILNNLPHRRHPRTSLLAEQLQLRGRKVNLIGKETILQAPNIWGMTFNNPHGTPAFRAHTTLHGFPTACVGIGVRDVARARDLNVLFRDHESEGGDAAAATLAGCAMA